ncbi:TPA: TIR domain-containing protein [Yersinia enterocolitica]
MYYHVLIEVKNGNKNGKGDEYCQFDIDNEDFILDKIINPYFTNSRLYLDGYFLEAVEVKRIVVKKSEKNSDYIYDFESRIEPGDMVVIGVSKHFYVFSSKMVTDITDYFLNKGVKGKSLSPIFEKVKGIPDKTKVFIVHGQDDLARLEVSSFLSKLGLEPIVLHEQASSGSTIIEKIEKYTDVGFGVVLYTPCDTGAKQTVEPEYRPRARQNVVFEHGYLIGKLSRKNVCALVKGDVETPNDISGVVYVPQDAAGAWKLMLAKELKSSGYNIDMNKAL